MWDGVLVGARFLQFAGASVLLGAALFNLYGFDPAARPAPGTGHRSRSRGVLVVSALVTIAGTFLWVMSEAVLFADDPAEGMRPEAVWLVFSGTRFGRACLLRIGLLVLSVAVATVASKGRTHRAMQVALAGLITATFAWTGHGAATAGMSGLVHLASDVLHLWAAGAWIGALVPLALLVAGAYRTRSLEDALAAGYGLDRFSVLGMTIIATLAVSGIINAWFLIGPSQWRTLNESSYGATLLVKLGLFGFMLMLGVINRIWLAPGLRASLEASSGQSWASLRALRTSILVETGLAVLVLLAVAVLGTLPPPRLGD